MNTNKTPERSSQGKKQDEYNREGQKGAAEKGREGDKNRGAQRSSQEQAKSKSR